MNKKGVGSLVMTIGILLIAVAAGSTLFAFGYQASKGRVLDARILAKEVTLILNAVCLNPNNFYADFEVNKDDYVVGIKNNVISVRTIDNKVVYSEVFSKELCQEVDSSFFEYGMQGITFSKEGNNISLIENFPYSEETIKLSEKGFNMDNFVWPSNNRLITSCFGARDVLVGSRFHEGIDIRSRYEGVFAISDGIVIGASSGTISIDHGKGVISRYLHLSKIDVKNGDNVKKGDRIAISGAENTKDPHLDFRISVDGKYVDPLATGMYDPNIFKYIKSDKKEQDSNCHYNSENYAYQSNIERNLEAA